MTAEQFADRLKGRRTAKGWAARCPAHDDRSPSLAIAAGNDGRVLVFCFRGCAAEQIARAAGVAIGDLFATASSSVSARRPRNVVDVEQDLEREVLSIRTHESKPLGFLVAELSRHRNAARAMIERRHDLRLRREPPCWYEVEPHCTDPAWSACVEAALYRFAAVAGLSVPALRAAIEHMPGASERVLTEARRLQRDMTTVAKAMAA